MISANSRYDQFLRGEVTLDPQEERGRKLFMAHPDAKVSLRGGQLHRLPQPVPDRRVQRALDGFSNNGLDDEEHLQPGLQSVTGNPAHRGMFKVPSLRNIALTAPYMHDGRFATLEEVLRALRQRYQQQQHAESTNRRGGQPGRIIAGRDQPASDGRGEGGDHRLPAHADGQGFVTAERFSDPFVRK